MAILATATSKVQAIIENPPAGALSAGALPAGRFSDPGVFSENI
jgi:hypothetical protein